MRVVLSLMILIASYGGLLPAQEVTPPSPEEMKARIASYPPDLQIYGMFRSWLTTCGTWPGVW